LQVGELFHCIIEQWIVAKLVHTAPFLLRIKAQREIKICDWNMRIVGDKFVPKYCLV
jgi:hypothetical protein